MSDEELIRQANVEIEEERLLVAARLLRQVEKQESLTPGHCRVMEQAQVIQNVIDVHLKPAQDDPTWKKQTESHGHWDTLIYYKVEEHSKLTCRIETPIEASLLVPLLAVFNESELYDQWMPKFRFPIKMGVRQSLKLTDRPGRGAQVCQVTVDMPFPISDREVVYDVYAVDAIEELSLISMKGTSLQVGDADGAVAEPEPGIKRIEFEVGWVIRQCPKDHPSLQNSKHEYAENEPVLLLSLTQFADAHVNYVPVSIINFVTRTALVGQWNSLLQVAQDVKDGKRPDHDKCIQDKQELYGWVNQRIEAMCAKMD
ncbi:expressed unknown protein [Seminavis robusta]|uniref:START domain-containing protein n=1 Tax=Seminavis robusta TaxID=568900 RepID=A0A9N8DFX8_9STRA|nr:expressed unknown protein [Seminavis robusta]|eukprot:Sro100_g051110.1 n/a (314) ;mRNA; r:10090-11031